MFNRNPSKFPPPVEDLLNAADRVTDNDEEDWRPMAYDPEVALLPRRRKRPPSEFSF